MSEEPTTQDFAQAFEKLTASIDRLNETFVHSMAILSKEITDLNASVQAQDARIEYLTDAVCDRLGMPKGNAKPKQPRPGIQS